jgi:hypothetical protein
MMCRFGGIHHVQCVRLRSIAGLWLTGLVFLVLLEVEVCVCVCAPTTKLKHIIPKSHAGRLLQNTHTHVQLSPTQYLQFVLRSNALVNMPILYTTQKAIYGSTVI